MRKLVVDISAQYTLDAEDDVMWSGLSAEEQSARLRDIEAGALSVLVQNMDEGAAITAVAHVEEGA